MDSVQSFEALWGTRHEAFYSQRLIDQILKFRKQLDNVLFFDRLLKAIGLDDATIVKLYPPRSNQDLRTLYQRITEVSSPELLQQSLVYYLLKDAEAAKTKACDYANHRYLSSRYCILVDGFWCLDRLKLDQAVVLLTDPSLVPTFPDEVLLTVCQHGSKQPRAAIAYYEAVKPPLETTRALDAIFNCICEVSVTEAWQFARQKDRVRQRHLLELLIKFVLNSPSGRKRAERATELIDLPLSAPEEAWFNDYLQEDAGRELPGAKDTLVMRAMVKGRGSRAHDLSQKIHERPIEGLAWSNLTVDF